MSYAVKEIFYSLQGEGAHTGRPAVFVRFAGCNLWSGREEDRADAVCRFCDTAFLGIDGPGGGRFTDADELAAAILSARRTSPGSAGRQSATVLESRSSKPSGGSSPEHGENGRAHPGEQRFSPSRPLIVLTGGEPLLQVDEELLGALRRAGFEVAVETNGTLPVPQGVDWLTVSPKAGAEPAVTAGDELKLVYPQTGAEPERFEDLGFRHFFLQPMDGPALDRNTRLALDYCLEHPQWRLSLQAHKLLGIP